jgi:hypothetical protein
MRETDLENIVHSKLQEFNPVTNFLGELHSRFGMDVKVYKCDSHMRQMQIPRMSQRNRLYNFEEDDILNIHHLDFDQISIPLHLINKAIRITEDALEIFKTQNGLDHIRYILETNEPNFLKCSNIPVKFAELPESIVCTSGLTVKCARQPHSYDLNLVCQWSVGILLSHKLHKHITEKMCKLCKKRLKCTLIPDDECTLSYLTQSYYETINNR